MKPFPCRIVMKRGDFCGNKAEYSSIHPGELKTPQEHSDEEAEAVPKEEWFQFFSVGKHPPEVEIL